MLGLPHGQCFGVQNLTRLTERVEVRQIIFKCLIAEYSIEDCNRDDHVEVYQK